MGVGGWGVQTLHIESRGPHITCHAILMVSEDLSCDLTGAGLPCRALPLQRRT